MSTRDVVFVTHANPDDNRIARWLTLKLTALGYRAWSDGTQLFGGEDFWKDIESVIRDKTAKLVFLLSRVSNHRDGCIRELRVANAVKKANGLHDFVIPLRIDDLPHGDMNIELTGLNTISAGSEWADALRQLVKKLEKDNVPRDSSTGPNAVRGWWETHYGADERLTRIPERHFSNWFPVTLPPAIHTHTLVGLLRPEQEPRWEFPTEMTRGGLVTFGTAAEITANLSTLHVQSTVSKDTMTFLTEDVPRDEGRRRRDMLTQFLTAAWERAATQRGLKLYGMSGNRHTFYFDDAAVPDKKVHFTGVDGERTWRAVIGYKTRLGRKRYWHFALSAKPALHPEPLLMIRSHVLFSDDATSIWPSVDEMHRARRSQCKGWWNDDWRDRLLGTMAWLAEGTDELRLPLSPSSVAKLSAHPVEFQSPVTLIEPEKRVRAADSDDLTAAEDADELADGADDEEEEV